MPIMIASHGTMPAWFATISAGPCEGTLTVPSTWTRHQRSYMNSRNGKIASANSSSKPHSSSV